MLVENSLKQWFGQLFNMKYWTSNFFDSQCTYRPTSEAACNYFCFMGIVELLKWPSEEIPNISVRSSLETYVSLWRLPDHCSGIEGGLTFN